MPACKGKLSSGRPCPKIVKRGQKYCRWHDPEDESWREIYERLGKATPNAKVDIMLELIRDHPTHRLVLPEREGKRANLSDIDLSPEALDKKRNQFRARGTQYWHDTTAPGSLRAELFGAQLQGAILRSANLQRAFLSQANLQGAELTSADLQNANLRLADLQDARLQDANLQGANLFMVKLQGVILEGAKLQNVDLSIASNMSNVRISGAWLDKTRIHKEQLGDGIGEEQTHYYKGAKRGYLTLKQNFDDLGDYEGASWAYRKERRMEKLEAWQDKKYFKFLSDTFVEWLCDYGESVWRVFFWMAALLFVIGPFVFSILGGIYWGDDLTRAYFTLTSPLEKFFFSYPRYLLYTFDTLTAVSYSDLRPGNDAVRLASGLFTAASIFLTGLLGFVAGNRIRRS